MNVIFTQTDNNNVPVFSKKNVHLISANALQILFDSQLQNILHLSLSFD